ncbi:hypothetical protein FOA43_002270 [Brettanomyces nanus]|uniref:ATP-dependent DNA helicase CHL1 n=1 Tax=Eeniella nana TaxID=13502 RepID=A0A875S4E0_EENNA|nr:uncharacterized protein FOA43_002270 [Brettanomyces nanus]QPG74932.1 hypothetical protein FOA43_002270 [Brettanomyces nanus]
MEQIIIHEHETTGRLAQAESCKFNHPFDNPYDVQLKLMNSIYETIDGDFKIGIFESPTGTGKTLSLICSTMTWLREFKRMKNDAAIKKKLGEVEGSGDEEEPEWIMKAYQEKIVGRMLEDAKRYEKHLIKVEKEGSKMVTGKLDGKIRWIKKRKRTAQGQSGDTDEDQLAPEDYTEESMHLEGTKFEKMDKEVKDLLKAVEGSRGSTNRSKERATEVNESPVKIFFASRTHSQLSQFCSQLKMTDFPSSIEGMDEKTKYLPLGSRKQLCINDKVASLKDTQQINERCIELQKDGNNKCPFLPKLAEEQDMELVDQFKDLTYSAVHDIEDLDTIGSNLKVCPYYSSRHGVPVAEIISLPYQLLLQKEARDSLKLRLKDCIVVIDEAHNLIDTINSIYSSSIRFEELKLIRKAMRLYTRRFYSRMNAGNRINLSKMIKLVTLLAKFIAKQIDLGRVSPGTEVDTNLIFAGTTGDLLNVYPLQKYINKSKIAFKVQSYMDKITDSKHHSTPLLFKVRAFMYSLSNTSQSGKFFFDKEEGDITLKYLLLDPSEPFKDIVEEARCVLLAGGTMEPVTDFTDFLVPYVDPSQMKTFSCDHVIPDENLEVYPVSHSGNISFDFTFNGRTNRTMLEELGKTIVELFQEVPSGTVIFFPSYRYLDDVMKVWKEQRLVKQMEEFKKIFIESREINVDNVLREFRSEIETGSRGGAALFSVVGGKMSEGINFSDKLARCVIMVGLPYPNVKSGELIAKSHYIEKKTIENGGSRQLGKQRSQEMYQNICMKAVNQSVGRAIRNIKDYAVIYLIDKRYEREEVQGKLSRWIQRRLMSTKDVLEARERTERFFKGRS